jgi:hypothetical protein
VKTIPKPKTKKEADFAKGHDACWKDIKRALVLCKLGLLLFVAELVLGQEKSHKHHESLCHSPQHDHWGWEGLKLRIFLWQCWQPSEAGKEPQSHLSISWDISGNWRLDNAHSTERRSHRAPLAASRGKLMPSFHYSFISFPTIHYLL